MRGSNKLSKIELKILRELSKKTMNYAGIQRAVDIGHHSTIKKYVQELEKRGLLRIIRGQAGMRKMYTIHITDDGKKFIIPPK